MYEAFFNQNGGYISIDIQYFGAVTCSYVYALWERDSNAIVQQQQGNNLNPQDDSYDLPTPNMLNNGRFVQVFSTLKNGTDSALNAVVNIKVYQADNEILDVRENLVIDPMETKINEIFIQLKINS